MGSSALLTSKMPKYIYVNEYVASPHANFQKAEKPIVYLDADGVLFDTPKIMIKKIFRDTEGISKIAVNTVSAISFFTLDLIPFSMKKLEKLIDEDNIKIDEAMLNLARELKANGIAVKILTANGETKLIQKLVESENLNVEVIKCSKREKAKKGGVLIDDSIITYALSKFYGAFSHDAATKQILVEGMHNEVFAKLLGAVGGRVGRNAKEIKSHLEDLGIILR